MAGGFQLDAKCAVEPKVMIDARYENLETKLRNLKGKWKNLFLKNVHVLTWFGKKKFFPTWCETVFN